MISVTLLCTLLAEEATKALSLNGIPFAGTMLSVRRPSSYKGTETEAPTWQVRLYVCTCVVFEMLCLFFCYVTMKCTSSIRAAGMLRFGACIYQFRVSFLDFNFSTTTTTCQKNRWSQVQLQDVVEAQ